MRYDKSNKIVQKNSLVFTLRKLLPHIRYLNAIRYDKVNKIVQNLTLDGLLHA